MMINPDQGTALRQLLEVQSVAALGTLHDGEPFVSMVPFALLPGGRGFVIHVSRLASHTRDMLASPAVSFMVMAAPEAGVAPQALARVTVQGESRQIGPADPLHAEAKTTYLARFPDSAPMFGFADFSLFLIEPRRVRFVGGFAQATTISAETLATILTGAGT